MIDPRAIIQPGAQLAADVSVGAFSIIGPNVSIGAAHPDRAARGDRRPYEHGRGQQGLPVCLHRRPATG